MPGIVERLKASGSPRRVAPRDDVGGFKLNASCSGSPKRYKIGFPWSLAAEAQSLETNRGKWPTVQPARRRAVGSSRLARRARAWTIRVRIRSERYRFLRSARPFGRGPARIGRRLPRPSQAPLVGDRSAKRGPSAASGGDGRRAAGRAAPSDHTFCRSLGFTALSRSLDAEQVHELVARFTSMVDGVIVGYGGSIDKHIGDAVMALFGAPRAHDDDPVRAARAALDIHEAMVRWSQSSARTLQAHIEIASGEVVAGAVRRADAHDYTVVEDSVKISRRDSSPPPPRMKHCSPKECFEGSPAAASVTRSKSSNSRASTRRSGCGD